MAKWPGAFPVHVDHAEGAHFTCADGLEHVDLCLGDTGAMTGHCPAATVAAIRAQAARGITTMLPTADAGIVAAELTRRFGRGPAPVTQWQFALSATDANRHLLRYARHVTSRPKVLVFDYCYHGSVDESFATLDATGAVVARRGNIGPPVPPAMTTVVVPFNDVAALRAALAAGDVAAVLAEPAMTNIGIVAPEPGFHAALRELTRAHATLLILDETHTLYVGPGGAVRAWGLEPDAVVVGKTIGGGIGGTLADTGLPWHVTQLGARAEYAFGPRAPTDGAQAAADDDFPLQQYLHLQALNRRDLLTPFHNMALMSPATTAADVDAHTNAFAAAAAILAR